MKKLLVLTLLLAACSGVTGAAGQPTAPAAKSAVVFATPTPTLTAELTSTPGVVTPAPSTIVPTPSQTASPTASASPTSTPTPPSITDLEAWIPAGLAEFCSPYEDDITGLLRAIQCTDGHIGVILTQFETSEDTKADFDSDVSDQDVAGRSCATGGFLGTYSSGSVRGSLACYELTTISATIEPYHINMYYKMAYGATSNTTFAGWSDLMELTTSADVKAKSQPTPRPTAKATPRPTPRPTRQPTPRPTRRPTQNCTPGYSPCIPPASDVDCYGGSGNGPAYTKPGVVYRVTGSDPYRLDADNDGRGCE